MPVAARCLSITARRSADDNPVSPTRPLTSTFAAVTADEDTSQSPFAAGVSRAPPLPKPQSGGRLGMAAYMRNLTAEQQEKQEQRKLQQQRTAQSYIQIARERNRAEKGLTARGRNDELMAFMGLRLEPGDVYSPHDLTPGEMRHYIGKNKIGLENKVDEIEATGVNPLDMYRNFTLIDEWRTHAGRIKHSSLTGYKPKNQRKIAKAVRRAIGLALVPSTHRHPERLARALVPTHVITRKLQERKRMMSFGWRN